MFKLENKLSKIKIKVLAILNMAAWHLLRPLECPDLTPYILQLDTDTPAWCSDGSAEAVDNEGQL